MSRSTTNLLLLLAGLLWGAGFVAQATAMEDIGPFTFMSLRFAIAAFAILPFAMAEARKFSQSPKLTLPELFSISSVGVMFFGAMSLQQVGLLATSVTNAGVLTGLYVVFTPIIAFVFLRQHQPLLVWPSAISAFVGIWLLGGGGLDKLSWGDWLVTGCAVFAALHVLAMGHAATSTNRPAAIACAQFAITATLSLLALVFVWAIGWEHEPGVTSGTLIAAAPEILYTALIGGALAFFIMAVCQQYARASDAAILMSSEALFAAVAGALILGERLTPLGYVGGALLFLAIIMTSLASATSEDSLK